MKFACVVFLMVLAITLAKQCSNRRTNSKLICYYSEVTDINTCMCTHIILPANSDAQTIDFVQEKFKGGHVLLTVNEFNEDLVKVLKNSKIDGLEINLNKLADKNDVPDFISTVKSKLGSDLFFAVSIPPRAELLAKFYDFKALTKHADLFILQTAFLGASQNVTFHPSRLSGLWDMQNTDSVVDLVSGMGAPLSKLVITAPVQAFQFTLQDEAHTAPGSPALEIKSLTREQLCNKMSRGFNWTLERDQDQAGPYIFRKNTWIAFDDATSMDIKAKYTRVRGLAGLALKDLTQDGGEKCGGTLLRAAHTGLSKQSRAPRGAVLQSLEREILETPSRPLDTIQISPYRISRVIDVEGNVHSIRQDTRTEFECARQGYFVHPRSCGRFYRCVKFDQLADDFNVFEFDCPDGLSFDSRYEVCVWPGSLPYSSACSGSSEIAPVPRTRFVCPPAEGYYADPENCRWFFACLDHGKSPMSAYEFRCPFGLVYDESRLVCEWPWLVPKCGSGSAVGLEYGSQLSFGGARLDTYNGLGALGVVGLGGISGPLIQPQAKVYTSVANGGIGHHSQGGLQSDLGYKQTLAGTGFNQGIFGSAQLASSGVSGHSSSAFHGKGSGIELVNVEQNVVRGSSLSSGDAYSGSVFNQHNQGVSIGPTYNNEGVVLQQQFLENHGGSSQSKHDQTQGGVGVIHGTSYQTNIDYGRDAYNLHGTSGYTAGGHQSNSVHLAGSNLAGNNGIQTASVIDHGIRQQQLSSSALNNQHQHQTNFVQSLPAVHSNDHSHGAVLPVAPVEKIHIVGGFSAVGTGGQSAIEVAHHNLNINNIAQVTSAPPISTFSISLPSPVSPVAAAPVPVVKSDSEAYEGGVVANVPELQYKIVAPSGSSVYFQSNFKDNADYSLSRGVFGLANISQNYVNYVSSTPTPLALSTINNYEYNNPISSFALGSTVKPLVTLDQKRVVHQGYHYPKPATTFEEPIQAVSPGTVASFSFTKHLSPTLNSYVTPKPTEILQPAVVSRFSINSAQKSIVATQPIVSVTPVVPIIEHRIAQVNRVQPIISVTPTVPIVQQNVQPAVVSSYNFQNIAKNEGYQYSKPLISFEAVQPVVAAKPTIHLKEPAIVSSYSFQNSFGSKQDYNNYPKPNADFEDKSFHFVQSAQPTSTFHGKSSGLGLVNVEQGGARGSSLSTGNAYSTSIFNQYNHGATYNDEDVALQQNSGFLKNHGASSYLKHDQGQGVVGVIHGASYETNIDYGRDAPAVVSTFSINSAQKPLSRVQPIVSVTPVASIIEHKVLPQVVSVTPTVPITQQKAHSAIVSNYNFQNVLKNEGYQYSKPEVSFNNQPVQPAIFSSFSINSAEKPASVVQPVVSVIPTVPIVQQKIQPGIVSSYNFQNVAQNEGYQNSKAAISFNTQPVLGVAQTVPIIQQRIHSIQPAAISSFSFQNLTKNGGYDYFKQTVPIESVVSVTPATTIIKETLQQHPAVISSHNYQNVFHNRRYEDNKQTVPVISVTETVPVIQHRVTPIQPAIVSRYSFQNEANNEGFQYAKQTVPLQPFISVAPTVPTIQQNVQPAVVSSYRFENVLNNRGYQNIKQTVPVVSVTETVPVIQHRITPIQPAIVSSYSFQNDANNEGFKYTKQTVPLQHLQPIVSIAPTVPTIQQNVQPAVVSSYNFQVSNNDGYTYNKHTIPVQPFQPAEHVSPAVPVITHKNVYSVQPSIHTFQNLAKSENYDYSKQISLQSVQPVAPTLPTIRKPVEPTVLTTYSYNNIAKNDYANHFSSEVKSTLPTHVFNEGYEYRKPHIAFEERPLQPIASVVSVTPSVPVINKNIQPFTNVERFNPIPSSPLFSYSYKNAEATRNEGYNFVKNEIKPVQPQGYSYPTPFIIFEEKPRKPLAVAVAEPTVQPILTVSTPVVPLIKQRVQTVAPVVASHISQIPLQNEKIFVNSGNFGEKVLVSTTHKPIIIEDTIVSKQEIIIKHPTSAANLQYYENREPVHEVPFVAKKAYVTGQEQNHAGYNYQKPAIPFEEGPAIAIPTVTSTTKYEQVLVPVKSSSHRGKVSFTTPTYVEDYYYTTPRSNIYISTPAPFSRSNGRSRTNLNAHYSELYSSTPKPSYASTIATVLAANTQPSGQFKLYDSRLQSAAVPKFTSTENSQFGKKYSYSSTDDQYNFKIGTSAPQSTYISTSTQNYVGDSVVVSTPKQTYLPAKISSGEYNIITSTQSASAPLRTNTGSKPKTYIRVNDFHPLLPAKLGAQCTCTSKTLTLRRKPTSAYEATSDDGYFVEPNTNQRLDNLNIPVQNGGGVLENYVYEPQKVYGVSATPSVIVKSTTNTILPVPAPTFTIRARVRVGQGTTPTTLFSNTIPLVQVTQAPEVFLKKAITPAVRVFDEEESRPSKAQIADVYNGPNLARTTVKGAIKEAISDNSFDRYGPGGWRSRQETLQGTVDCQRAGLFRHPEQCNKFYACRWDCTKKRFTLHVFNCPVHLTFDSNLGACNWPSQGPACAGNTLLPNE